MKTAQIEPVNKGQEIVTVERRGYTKQIGPRESVEKRLKELRQLGWTEVQRG